MSYQQQMLTYQDNTDGIATIAHALDLLRERDVDAAARLLVVYLDHLQEGQRPKLVDYDPRLEMR